MQDKLCFVQFLHPGREHGPDTLGVKEWTRGPHGRKFLYATGRYLLDHQVYDGELGFWGEWEAQSTVEAISDPLPDGPRWVHRPYWISPTSYRDLQNTDPFVFGERFHYSGCLQYTMFGPTQLRNLSRGSVILFGSSRHANFVIDTVFVVADHIDHSMRDYQRKLGDRVSETYFAVTLAPWYGNMREQDRVYRLYLGATPDNAVDGMFSFFACLPGNGIERGFARPLISIPEAITPTMKQGKRLNPQTSIAGVKNLWGEVVRQVTNKGLELGTYVDLPGRLEIDPSRE